MLWKKDDDSFYYASIWRKAFLREMVHFLDEKIDEFSPNSIRPGCFLHDRAFQFSNVRKSGKYFIYLLAIDYLDVLDEFMELYPDEFGGLENETEDEETERIKHYKTWNF